MAVPGIRNTDRVIIADNRNFAGKPDKDIPVKSRDQARLLAGKVSEKVDNPAIISLEEKNKSLEAEIAKLRAEAEASAKAPQAPQTPQNNQPKK
jgi:hypothetical protein